MTSRSRRSMLRRGDLGILSDSGQNGLLTDLAPFGTIAIVLGSVDR